MNKDIARAFGLAAPTYDQHAFMQKEVGNRLLERVSLLKNPPSSIIDIGAGTGFLTRQLQKKYPKSNIFGIDISFNMMLFAKNKQPWQLLKNKPSYFCADAKQLPFKTHSVDMIFSNLTLQWCEDLPAVFAECRRVLKPNGMLFFSTLGPLTLRELRASWAMVDPHNHVNTFSDMHDIGDALLHTPFVDPVMDMEIITISYPEVRALLTDLKATGAHHVQHARCKGCTSQQRLLKMIHAYETFKQAESYPATFEVLYGHAVNPPQRLARPIPTKLTSNNFRREYVRSVEEYA